MSLPTTNDNGPWVSCHSGPLNKPRIVTVAPLTLGTSTPTERVPGIGRIGDERVVVAHGVGDLLDQPGLWVVGMDVDVAGHAPSLGTSRSVLTGSSQRSRRQPAYLWSMRQSACLPVLPFAPHPAPADVTVNGMTAVDHRAPCA